MMMNDDACQSLRCHKIQETFSSQSGTMKTKLIQEAPSESIPLLGASKGDSLVPPHNGAIISATGRRSTDLAVALDTVKLAAPIFISRLSWVAMKTMDAALLGHVSADALAAAALSDLYTMSTMVLVKGRVLGVFVGQAVGANNPRLAGIYLQTAIIVLGGLSMLFMLSWALTEQVWLALGQGEKLSCMAGYYARILALSILGDGLFSQLSRFFSAQRIMYPEVLASTVGMVLHLALGLVFVLGIPFPDFDGYGFQACPIVTTTVVYIQVFTCGMSISIGNDCISHAGVDFHGRNLLSALVPFRSCVFQPPWHQPVIIGVWP
jgi:MATE family multidrug resistance protein